MSDPNEANKANPHPVSQHRTPLEIAKDEAGPIGQPDLDVIAKAVPKGNSPRKPAAKRALRAMSSKRPGKRR
jgi:hypothetical protein